MDNIGCDGLTEADSLRCAVWFKRINDENSSGSSPLLAIPKLHLLRKSFLRIARPIGSSDSLLSYFWTFLEAQLIDDKSNWTKINCSGREQSVLLGAGSGFKFSGIRAACSAIEKSRRRSAFSKI